MLRGIARRGGNLTWFKSVEGRLTAFAQLGVHPQHGVIGMGHEVGIVGHHTAQALTVLHRQTATRTQRPARQCDAGMGWKEACRLLAGHVSLVGVRKGLTGCRRSTGGGHVASRTPYAAPATWPPEYGPQAHTDRVKETHTQSQNKRSGESYSPLHIRARIESPSR